MDKNQIIYTGRRLFLTVGQLMVIVLCLGFIEFIYYTDILPDKQVKDTYVQTQCSLMQKQLPTKGSMSQHFRSDFLLSYNVNGKQYQSWATGNGLDDSYFSDRASQETLLSQFDTGQLYDCWYNPKHPQLIVLVIRHDWTSTIPLLIPTAVLLIVLYYFMQSFFSGVGVVVSKTREIKTKKRKK